MQFLGEVWPITGTIPPLVLNCHHASSIFWNYPFVLTERWMALTVILITKISEQILLFIPRSRGDISCLLPRGRPRAGACRGLETCFRFCIDCWLDMFSHVMGPYVGLLLLDDAFNSPSTPFTVGTPERPCTPLAIDLHPTHPSV